MRENGPGCYVLLGLPVFLGVASMLETSDGPPAAVALVLLYCVVIPAIWKLVARIVDAHDDKKEDAFRRLAAANEAAYQERVKVRQAKEARLRALQHELTRIQELLKKGGLS